MRNGGACGEKERKRGTNERNRDAHTTHIQSKKYGTHIATSKLFRGRGHRTHTNPSHKYNCFCFSFPRWIIFSFGFSYDFFHKTMSAKWAANLKNICAFRRFIQTSHVYNNNSIPYDRSKSSQSPNAMGISIFLKIFINFFFRDFVDSWKTDDWAHVWWAWGKQWRTKHSKQNITNKTIWTKPFLNIFFVVRVKWIINI